MLPPSSAARHVARPRLYAALDAGLEHPLTLVSAPAGFGKTALVRMWLAQRREQVLWVTCTAGMNARSLWDQLSGALATLHPQLGARLHGLLAAPELPPPAALAAMLLGDLAQHLPAAPILLILDDLHTMTDPQIYAALRLLIERLPPWLRLVLIARHDPPLPIARWRAYGEIGEVRAADLRLTLSETAELLALLARPDLSAAHVEALYARTEGWVVALRLAALALARRSDPDHVVTALTGTHRQLVSYLLDEVFSAQPPATQRFLLHTSMLDRLCGSLCAAVLDMESAASATDLLVALEQRNLFLTALDAHGEWFRYERLFAEMLRHQLAQREPELAAVLHRRAAAWHEAHADLDAAFTHYAAAGDPAELAAFVERHGRRLISRSRTVQLRRWLDRLAPEQIAQRPLLTIYVAWLLMLSGRSAAAADLLDTPAVQTTADPRVGGEAAALHCSLARYRGDPAAVERYGAAARAALPADRGVHVTVALNTGLALLSAGREAEAEAQLNTAVAQAGPAAGAYGGLMALHALARTALRNGRPGRALALCVLAEQRAAEWGAADVPALGAVLVCAAEAHALTGAVAEALAVLDRADALLAGTIELNPTVRAAALRAQLEPGRLGVAARLAPTDRAIAWLDTLQSAAAQSRAWLALQRARIALAHQAYAAAAAWVAFASDDLDRETVILQRLVAAQVALAGGHDPAPLRDELTLLSAELAQRGWLLLRIEAMLLCGAAHDACGAVAAGHAALTEACTLAAPEHLVGPLVNAAAGLTLHEPFAHLQAAWSRQPGFADRLALLGALQQMAAPAPVPPAVPPATLHEPLSPREHEILHLIADGLSNQAIADTLVVALNTVKWYSSEIYAKLGVRSRTQALIRARELGLIS